MGLETFRRSWRQARSNSSIVSFAGRTATLPITTFLPLSSAFFGDDDIGGVLGVQRRSAKKLLGMKENSFFLPLIDDF